MKIIDNHSGFCSGTGSYGNKSVTDLGCGWSRAGEDEGSSWNGYGGRSAYIQRLFNDHVHSLSYKLNRKL